MTKFAYPFEPWVVKTWEQCLDQTDARTKAEEFRKGLTAACRIANDPNLSWEEKIAQIQQLKNCDHPEPSSQQSHTRANK
jgi:hypothetical protein